MTRQVFALPASGIAITVGQRVFATWNIRQAVDAGLLPDGSSGSFVTGLDIRTLTGTVTLRATSALSSTWHAHSAAVTLKYGDLSHSWRFEHDDNVVGGYNYTNQDRSWDTLIAGLEPVVRAIANTNEAQRLPIQLILDDGVPDTPTVSNKITTLAENKTHDFNIKNADRADGTLSFRLKAGSTGAITAAGVYTPPNVSADTSVSVELIDTVSGTPDTVTVRDTVTFTVTPVFTGRIANKIVTLRENPTHDFNASGVSAGDSAAWSVKAGGGAITGAGVYSPPNISANREVTVALLVGGVEVDTDTFTVTPVFLPEISNKINTLKENQTHDFNVGNADTATGALSWRASAGAITGAGVYTPHNVAVPTEVTVELYDGNIRRDSDTFTVTPVFSGTIANKITTLREDETHDFEASGISAGDTASWSVKSGTGSIDAGTGVYTPANVSSNSTVVVALSVGGEEQDTDQFTVQPVQTGQKHYAYLDAGTAPALPAPQNQRDATGVPANWSPNVLPAAVGRNVYRISRDVTLVGGAVAAGETDWTWDPAAQPWRAAHVSRRQHAFRRAKTLHETNDLPSSRTETLPAGWAGTAQQRTEDAGVWRISRTVTAEADGKFISAAGWAWNPTYASQPYLKSLAGLSPSIRRFTTTVRHKPSGALAQVIWAIHADLENAIPGAAAISKIFAVTLGSAAPDDNGEARLLAGSDAIATLTPANAGTVTAIEMGLSTGTAGATLDRRRYFPQVEAGDVVSVYENRDDNWADYLVTTVPASISTTARKVSFGLSHLENGDALKVTRAVSVGFSRAPAGRDALPRNVLIYVANKTDTKIDVGTPKPLETPTSYEFKIFTGTGSSAKATKTATGNSTGARVSFTGLTANTLYRIEAKAIYGTGDAAVEGPLDTQFVQTGVVIDEGVAKIVGVSPSSVKVTAPEVDGTAITYDWQYDIGRSNTLVWIDLPRTAKNETNITGLRNNSTLRVRYRANVGNKLGNWRSIGEGYVPQAVNAPSNVRNVVLTINTDGTYNVAFDAPSTNARPINRYGAVLFRNGQFAGWFEGQGTTSRDRDGYDGHVLYFEGDYHAEVRAVSLSATDDASTVDDDLTGDWVASNVVRWGGVPFIDDKAITA